MAARKRKRRTRVSSKSGLSLIGGLVKTLEKQDFDHQLTETARHLGMSKQEVLTTILGR